MLFKKEITNALTETAIEALKKQAVQRIEQLRREMDLDQNGQNDIDQAIQLVENVADGCRQVLCAIDFERIGTAWSKVSNALHEAKGSIDMDAAKPAAVRTQQSSAELLKLVGLVLANYQANRPPETKS